MKKEAAIRVLVEGILIFVSVLLAFLVENYRQNKLDREAYIKTLTLFRDEVHENIRRFGSTYDSSLSKFRTGKALPFLIKVQRQLRHSDSLFYDNERSNDLMALDSLAYASKFIKWRYRTDLIDQLNNFPRFAQEDSLVLIAVQFKSIMDEEFDIYEEWNKKWTEKENAFNQLLDIHNYLKHNKVDMYKILADENFMRDFRNYNSYFLAIVDGCILTDSDNADRLRNLTLKLDRILFKHGIDTSRLDKRYLSKK